MARYYKAFMDAVTPASASDTDRFLAGVQCVIWASLYVEASVNEVGANLFGNTVHPQGKKHRLMWNLAERAELDKKVQALAEMFESNQAIIDESLKKLRRLIRIRNRLVHYKEAPTPADSSLLFEKVTARTIGEMIDSFTTQLCNPDVVPAVMSMSLDARKHEATEICEWLASLRPA